MNVTRRPRPLGELAGDSSGQMAVEWVLVTVVVLLPLFALVPAMLALIRDFFYQIAGVLCQPFP